MKTISEQIADLEATRGARVKRMGEITGKSRGEGRSMDDAESAEFDTIDNEIKRLDGDIQRLKRLEAIEAGASKGVQEPAKQNAGAVATGNTNTQGGNLQLKHNEKLEPGIGFARYARVKALAYTGQAGTRDEAQIAQHLYPHDEALIKSLHGVKSPVPAASTLSETWAGNMILDRGAAFADFVEFLRARSIYGQVQDRFRRLPFDAPVLVQGSGASGAWTKEGDAKPLRQWTYTKAKLTPLKVTAIAASTKELLMRASGPADALLRDELARAVNATIDTTLFSDAAAVADESPAGLRNGTSALTLTGDGTVAGIRCDVAAMMQELVGDNLSVAGAFWVMSEKTAIALSLVANEIGAQAFPGIGPTGGTFVGLPAFTSEYIQDESEGAVVILVKGDEIFLGDEGGIQVSVSDQASLQMDDAPSQSSIGTPTATSVVSLWQTNSVGFRVERFLNWQKRRASAVVWANVNWDACAS